MAFIAYIVLNNPWYQDITNLAMIIYGKVFKSQRFSWNWKFYVGHIQAVALVLLTYDLKSIKSIKRSPLDIKKIRDTSV